MYFGKTTWQCLPIPTWRTTLRKTITDAFQLDLVPIISERSLKQSQPRKTRRRFLHALGPSSATGGFYRFPGGKFSDAQHIMSSRRRMWTFRPLFRGRGRRGTWFIVRVARLVTEALERRSIALTATVLAAERTTTDRPTRIFAFLSTRRLGSGKHFERRNLRGKR